MLREGTIHELLEHKGSSETSESVCVCMCERKRERVTERVASVSPIFFHPSEASVWRGLIQRVIVFPSLYSGVFEISDTRLVKDWSFRLATY